MAELNKGRILIVDDEDVVREAQRLAAEMIARIALVGATLNNDLLQPLRS